MANYYGNGGGYGGGVANYLGIGGVPYQAQMDGSNNNGMQMMELPPGRCSDMCQSFFCPCYVFGRLVNKMHGGRPSVDVVACGTWAAFVLLCWGGTAAAAQLLAAQVAGGAQYSVYAMYSLYYLEYMYPYMQAMYMYKSLKGVHNANGGQGLRDRDRSVEVSVPCSQWCTFMICPCVYLGRASTFVNMENNPQDTNRNVALHLEQRNLCPFEFYNDYEIEARAIGRQNNNMDGRQPTPMADYMQQQQQQQW